LNFSFDADQKSLGESVARLLADHGALRSPDLSPDAAGPAWSALAELGLFAMMVPEEFGGAGLNAIDLTLAIETMGANLAPLSAIEALLVTDLLVTSGTPAQKQAYLPRLALGELKVAVALVESESGEGIDNLRATVTDGILTGSKILVSEGANADLFVVFAQGGSIYLVPADAKGVEARPHVDIDPTCAFCEVHFDKVALGADALVGTASSRIAADRLLDAGAALLASYLTGIASRMLDNAVEYARTREQFGQPIGAFQAIKHRCADMAVALEGARSVTYYGVWAFSEIAPDRARAISMAKAYAGEVSRHICNETIQVHGGMGFTWELGLHRYLRRAKIVQHAFGSSEYHNERVLVETLASLEQKTTSEQQAA